MDNKKLQAAAERLLKLMEQKKKIDDDEHELRTFLKAHMKKNKLHDATFGSARLVYSKAVKTYLDKSKILESFGSKFVEEYSSETSYDKLEVRKTALGKAS